jgi:mono/diheme cytochrome c family protein
MKPLVALLDPAALRRALALVAIVLAIVLTLGAPAGEPWAAGVGGSTHSTTGNSDPKALYHNYCSVCHGDKGDGKSRATGALSTLPRDFTNESARAELSVERIAAAIAHGRPGTAMTGWKTQLSDKDIAALAQYVHQRFVLGQAAAGGSDGSNISGTRAHGGREADAVSTSARVDMTAGLPNGLKGDPRRGGAFYLANCATCHGARGDGAGPRAYFINPKPRNFIDEAARARYSRPLLYVSVSEGRVGTEMPAWKHVSTAQQMADVSEYVFQAFVQGKPVAGVPR